MNNPFKPGDLVQVKGFNEEKKEAYKVIKIENGSVVIEIGKWTVMCPADCLELYPI